MAHYINNLLFTYLPHIALAILVFGIITRLIVANKTIQAESTQLLTDNRVKLGSNLFHVGIIFVFFGHLTLFFSEELYHLIMTIETKRLIALSIGSFFGTMVIVGMPILIIRRFSSPPYVTKVTLPTTSY